MKVKMLIEVDINDTDIGDDDKDKEFFKRVALNDLVLFSYKVGEEIGIVNILWRDEI